MKYLLMFLLFTPFSFAAVEVKENLIREVNATSLVLLNSETARCSDIGYGNLQLKVSVPDLAWMSIYNHANPGETQPCISAGRCRSGFAPGNLIDPNRPYENVPLNIRVVEKLTINHDQKSCFRQVDEHVASEIRGIKFTHLRSGGESSMPYSICVKRE